MHEWLFLLFWFRVKLCFGRRVVSPEDVHVAWDVGQPLGVIDPRIERQGRDELSEPPDFLAARFREGRVKFFDVSVVGKLGASVDVDQVVDVSGFGFWRRFAG